MFFIHSFSPFINQSIIFLPHALSSLYARFPAGYFSEVLRQKNFHLKPKALRSAQNEGQTGKRSLQHKTYRPSTTAAEINTASANNELTNIQQKL